MQNLIYFLLQYGYILLFVLLQLLSVSLIVRFNEHQHNVFLSSTNNLTSWINDRVDRVQGYFGLATVSKELARENANLRKQIATLTQDAPSSIASIRDSSNRQFYDLIPAKVVSNSITGMDNFLSINKGYLDGIEEGMGIISEHGVVGVVTDVSKHYAQAISLLNRSFRVSAKLDQRSFFGYLEWLGGNPKRASLTDIPKHAQVDVGDKISTSGYSTIFPAGIGLGEVAEVSLDDGSNFYTISMEIYEDHASLTYVYVVDNLEKQQQFDATNTSDP